MKGLNFFDGISVSIRKALFVKPDFLITKFIKLMKSELLRI